MRYSHSLLASFLIGFVASAGAADPAESHWKSLYVFGDSFSDYGAGYVDGDGPTAVVYLANQLGIQFTHSSAADRAGKSLNFAVSGATTGGGDGRKVKDALLGRGLQTQVEDFVARVKSRQVAFDPDCALFFIAGGLNDRNLATDETVANVERLVATLRAAGARHFLIAVLPRRIPAFSAVGERLSPLLAAIPARLNQRFPGIHAGGSRWGEYFDEVLASPERYGIANTRDACAGRALFDEDSTPRGDPSSYYYYHAGHPSTAVHRHVGKMLHREAVQFAKDAMSAARK